MKLLNFRSVNVAVDWISFNIQGLPDPRIIAHGLSRHFNPHVQIDGKPEIAFHSLKKNLQEKNISSTIIVITNFKFYLPFGTLLDLWSFHFTSERRAITITEKSLFWRFRKNIRQINVKFVG